ncbi:aminomethyltransferase [Alicyclobacillus sacchari]|uniref:Aminomethyltransferase n=1 Tax=Alicyclobacillus sacchari TaxID=392010 RepID=A0A4R8LIW3_9BACL|nr:glycine cleavage system aminomethyltransferase GcvT [Alicyclobacillus sacchari]TDY43383.1 aminomethyltransferase [Alicyclobacillus sacchari]
MGKRTSLYDAHLRLGAKVIDFHGFEMPVQYRGIREEHTSVRSSVGIFDVSHMGEIEVQGEGARLFLQHLVTNDVERLRVGRAMYTLMLDETGGVIDDLLVYQLAEDMYWLVVNASNIADDFAWIRQHADGYAVTVQDRSDEVALVAVQGPEAATLLSSVAEVDVTSLRPFSFLRADLYGGSSIISRTGYTGEDGFEVYASPDVVQRLFTSLIDRGALPCGLGARDTLRLEACLPLYGNELNRDITPLEAGLDPFVKLEKGPFIGRDALAQQRQAGLLRKLVGLQMDDRAIARGGYPVWHGEKVVGHITSGTLSPTLGVPIALALVDASYAEIGQPLDVEIRNKRYPAHVVQTPFYKRPRGNRPS